MLAQLAAPQWPQLAAAGAVAGLFALVAGLVAVRLWRGHETPTKLARGLTVLATLLTAGVLAWHLWPQLAAGSWRPFGDNFEALLWLALVPAAFVAHVQARRPVPGLELYMLPIVSLTLAAAAVVEAFWPRTYDVSGAVVTIHRVSSYAGAAAFAVAAVAGVLYLRQSGRLRSKSAALGPRGFGGLERLEHWSFAAAVLGFALLTLGLVTGLARVGGATTAAGTWSPKIVLAVGAWATYALALHAPLLPCLSDLRGRGTAWLSVAGFALMLATLAAVQWMPDSPLVAGVAR